MDVHKFLDCLLNVFSSSESLGILEKIYYLHLTSAGGRLSQHTFTQEEYQSYEETVRVCLKHPPSDKCRTLLQHEAQRVACAYVTEAVRQKRDVFEAYRFFFRTLAHMKGVIKMNELVPGELQRLSCDFWKGVFIDDRIWERNEKKTTDFLEDLRLLGISHYQENTEFSVFLVENLRYALNNMKSKLSREDYDKRASDIYLLQANCYYYLGWYKQTVRCCRHASELSDCTNYQASELWAKALFKEKQYSSSLRQIETALKLLEDTDLDIYINLKDLMAMVNLAEANDDDQDASLADSDWLSETNVYSIDSQKERAKQAQKRHVKKKKRSRPKRKYQERSPESENEAKKLKMSQKNENTVEAKRLCQKEEFRKLVNDPCYPNWSSDDEENSQIFTEDVPKENVRTTKIEKINWFEVSKQKYKKQTKDTKIYSGMFMDLNEYPPNLNKQMKKESFYRTMESKEKIEEIMITNPNEFKRCKITLKSAHEAVCKVLSSDEHTEIEIHGRSKCGQTFNHDEVCVEILSKPRHHAPDGRILQRVKDDNKVFGRVVGVIESSFKKERNPVVACICDRNESYLMLPLCGSIPKLHVRNERSRASNFVNGVDMFTKNEKGDLSFKMCLNITPGQQDRCVFLVVFLKWDIEQVYPLGAVVDVIECGIDIKGGMKLLEMQYKVPSHFEKNTVDHVDKMLKRKDSKQSEKRDDHRDLTVFTIDPEHSKDLDDALSICKEDDHFIVGVHIADVTAVVQKGDPVDKEAKRRATSFYPSEFQVRHMLPEPLSEQLCSLLPNEDKCALSVFFHIEESGMVRKTSVERTFIRSSQKLSYQNAQDIIDGCYSGDASDEVKESVSLLHKIAQNMRKVRLKDARFAVPFEDISLLDEYAINKSLEAHVLVEEFMIKANTFIAHWLEERYQHCIPVVCQSKPPIEKLEKFLKTEENIINIVIELQGRKISHNSEVSAQTVLAKENSVGKEYLPVQKDIWLQILDGVHVGKMKDAMKALCQDEVHPFQAVALDHWRSIMESAEYRCSMETERNLNHFSLQTKLYTHFTSPIRRYVDLVVHRLVHAALDNQPCPYSPKELSDMCGYINDATTRQKHFRKGCSALKIADKVLRKPIELTSYIKSLTEGGAELYIPALKQLSTKSKELPFNLLDLNKKPEGHVDAISNKTVFWGKWKKRIYDCNSCENLPPIASRRMGRRTQKFVLNPDQHVIFVDTQTWATLLMAHFNQETSEAKQILKSQFPEGINPPQGPPLTDIVTSENSNGIIKFHQCKFELRFAEGLVLKVQMVANPLRGLLTPKVSLFQVSKNLSLCLTHMEDPVGVLSKYAMESSKKNIESITEYQRIWLPLLEMEAATSAIHSEENVIINNVKLVFKCRDTYDGYFVFTSNFIINRSIEFCGTNLESKKHSLEDITEEIENSDYLCIRCPIKAKSEKINKQEFETIRKVVEIPRLPDGTFVRVRALENKGPLFRRMRRKKVLEIENPMKTQSRKRIPNERSYTWVGHAQITEIKRKKSRNLKSQNYLVRVSFKFNSNCGPIPRSLLPSTFGTVEVIFKYVVDRMTIDMLQSLESSTLASSIATNSELPELEPQIFSCAKDIMKKLPSHIGDLPLNNEVQSNAIQTALTSSFSLIQGPPGTGKTYTGIKLLYFFNKVNQKVSKDDERRQVLFCGPSNKSVDLVAWYMLNRLGPHCPRIIRVYGALIESSDYPGPKNKFLSKRSLRDLKSDPRLKDVTLHHMIRKGSNTHSRNLRSFDALFEKKPDSITPLQERQYRECLFLACSEELVKCDIILCTCAVGGSIKLSYSANIQQVVIDECAMSTEPQSMVPIIASQAKQVVLIGDHKQLRPIIKCKEAATLGLDRSLFERYADEATFLNVQYRMHEEICKFPSKKFYDGKLTTGHRRIDRPLTMFPRQTIPLVFCHVEGVEETLTVSSEEGNEQSKSNQAEVDKVEQVFSWIVKKERIQGYNINVMSQYNAQCSKIKEKLYMYYSNKNHINVNTVVASQGGEWDYVIFSTVRSLPEYKIERNPTRGWSTHNLGFITDQNQINVALTRARKGLIIIGNKHLLKCDKVFRSLIEEYEAMGCLVNGHEFPRRFQ